MGSSKLNVRSVAGRMVIAAGLLVLAVAFVMAQQGQAGQQQAAQPKAKYVKDPAVLKVVERTVAIYKACKTYREKWIGEFAMVIGGQAMPIKLRGELVFKAPALIAARQQDSTGSKSTLVLTNEKFFMDSSDAKLSVSGPAPKPDDAKAILALVNETGAPLPFGFLASRFDEFDAGEIVIAERGISLPSEWVRGLEQPENCDAYTIVLGGEGAAPTVMWIDRQSGAVRKMALEVNRKILDEMGLLKPDQQVPEGVGVRVEVDVKEAAIDGPVDDAAFTYEAPEGLEQIEVASVEEAIAKMAEAEKQAQEQQAGQQEQGGGQREPQGLEGKNPPDFTAKTLDGKDVKLSDLKGKPFVVDFWATWCPPCRREMPILDEFAKKLKEQGLVVVCVSLDRDMEAAKKFIKGNGYSMTVWWVNPAPNSPAAKVLMEQYGLRAIPRTLYVGKDFVVKHDMTGLHPRQEMVKAVSDLGIDVSALGQ